MFGGYGIFRDGKMFGIVDSSGAWYLKADEATSRRYESAGSEKHGRMPYWSVPEEVAADEPKLQEWARDAIQA